MVSIDPNINHTLNKDGSRSMITSAACVRRLLSQIQDGGAHANKSKMAPKKPNYDTAPAISMSYIETLTTMLPSLFHS